jgi:hypothetical protein
MFSLMDSLAADMKDAEEKRRAEEQGGYCNVTE